VALTKTVDHVVASADRRRAGEILPALLDAFNGAFRRMTGMNPLYSSVGRPKRLMPQRKPMPKRQEREGTSGQSQLKAVKQRTTRIVSGTKHARYSLPTGRERDADEEAHERADKGEEEEEDGDGSASWRKRVLPRVLESIIAAIDMTRIDEDRDDFISPSLAQVEEWILLGKRHARHDMVLLLLFDSMLH